MVELLKQRVKTVMMGMETTISLQVQMVAQAVRFKLVGLAGKALLTLLLIAKKYVAMGTTFFLSDAMTETYRMGMVVTASAE